MFVSTYESKVDDKKRVSVPAAFRKVLCGEGSVYVWPSIDPGKNCLEGGSRKLIDKMYKAMRRLKPMDPRRRALEYGILGQCQEFSFDAGGGGRIVLPKKFIDYAGVANEVKFVGLGERFEIWSTENHEAMAAEMVRLAEESGDALGPIDFDFDDEEMA